jgi:hypothetical protein
MNLIEKFLLWKESENPAPVTLRNIWRVIVSYYRRFFPLIPKHITEQAEHRKSFVKKECMDRGACVICGCDVEGLLYLDDSCEGLCYPKMMSKKAWNTYKKINFIK